MLTSIGDLLARARSTGTAVGAFSCYTIDNALGVLDAAGHANLPVILLVGARSFSGEGGRALIAALRILAADASSPVAIQLDHVDDLGTIRAAFESGVQGAMVDGSRLPFDENVRLTCEAQEIASAFGGELEAELGWVEGDEDVASGAPTTGQLTDPEGACRFVEATRVACLAVSIGNVHGTYAHPPRLDWERLESIRRATDVPLALHGASGLADGDLLRAIAGGVCKINVNTELRARVFAALADRLDDISNGWRMLDLLALVRTATAAAALEKLLLYSGQSRA